MEGMNEKKIAELSLMNELDAIDMKRKNKFNGVEWRQRERENMLTGSLLCKVIIITAH